MRNLPLIALCFGLFFGVVASSAAGQGLVFEPGGMSLLPLKSLAERQQTPAGVRIAVWPSEVIDANRIHYLNTDTLTIMILSVANPSALVFDEGWISIDVPVDVNVVTANTYLTWNTRTETNITRDSNPYVRYEFLCSVDPTTIPQGFNRNSWYGRHRPPAVWLRTALAAGANPGKVYYRFRYRIGGSTVDSQEGWVTLAVLPEISASQPAIAKSGAMGRFILNWPGIQAHADELTGYIKQLGYSYFMGLQSQNEQFVPGLERWSELQAPRNGAEISLGVDLPFDIRFVKTVTPFPDDTTNLPRVACPAAIYQRDPWIVTNVFGDHFSFTGHFDDLVGRLNSVAGVANWEPWPLFPSNGCLNNLCMEDFITWLGLSGLPAQTIRDFWPDIIGWSYPTEWLRFQNWQHGEIVRVCSEEMAFADPNARFGIWTGNGVIWGDDVNDIWIESWGDMAYDVWTWSFYYVPNGNGVFPISGVDRIGAAQVVRFGALTRHLDNIFGLSRQTKFGGLYGWDQTGGGGFFFPEQLGFLHLSTIFAGASMVQNYAEWPVWDGRYAEEIAKANTRIAFWEDYIVNGTRQRQHVVLPRTVGYPQSWPENVEPNDQEPGPWIFPGYMFSFEYEKLGKRLITVANTWDDGECFFDLRVLGLDPNTQYVLWEPEEQRSFAAFGVTNKLSAADLAGGIQVHAGAMRWGAFLIEPYNGATNYGSVIPGADITTCAEVWSSGIGFGFGGDTDKDCDVDIFDMAALAVQFLNTAAGCDDTADVNNDCVVDFVDYAKIADDWTKCNDPASMPPCVATW